MRGPWEPPAWGLWPEHGLTLSREQRAIAKGWPPPDAMAQLPLGWSGAGVGGLAGGGGGGAHPGEAGAREARLRMN